MTEKTIRYRWLMSIVVVLVLVASACESDGGGSAAPVESDPPASTSAVTSTTSSSSETASAIQVATDFLEAYWALDAEGALPYMTDEVLSGFADGGPEGLRLVFRQNRAWRLETEPTAQCEVVESSATGGAVVCPYEYHMLGSDQLGLGPYQGATRVTVNHGKVVALDDVSEVPQGSPNDPFSDEVWKPFERWVRANHPEDVDLFFGDGWLTEESFRAWEQRIPEYVESETAPAIQVATDFLEAYWARDMDTALSYLTDEGLRAEGADVPYGLRLEFTGGAVPLQLASAWGLKTEAAGPCHAVEGVKEMSPAGGAVLCPYQYHMLGSDQLGLGPYQGATLVTVKDGKVVSVEDASEVPQGSPNDSFSNEVWKPFERWVRANHPEDVDLFFGDGWLTEEAFRAWEQRIPEYVESETG